MKRSLYEQLRIQKTFLTIQWRNDILNYFVSSTLAIIEKIFISSYNGRIINNIQLMKLSMEMNNMNIRIYILFYMVKFLWYVYWIFHL